MQGMVEPKTTFDYVGEIWSIADWVRDVIRPAHSTRTGFNPATRGIPTKCSINGLADVGSTPLCGEYCSACFAVLTRM